MCAKHIFVATAVLVLCFAFPRSSVSEKTACQRLDEAYSHTKDGAVRPNMSVYIHGRPRQVSVYWDGRETSRAAAALLVTILRHGLRYQGLNLVKNNATMCELASKMQPTCRDYDQSDAILNKTNATMCELASKMQQTCKDYDQSDAILNNLLLIPAIGWDGKFCPSMEICFTREVVPLRLQVAGGSAAPLRLKMHVVLMASARNQPLCQNASHWDFYRNLEALVKCGFTTSHESNATATLWYATSAPISNKVLDHLKERLKTSLLHFSPLESYMDLHRIILNGVKTQTNSMLFLDYDIWANVSSVQLMKPLLCSEEDCNNDLDNIRSLRVADVPVLQQFAPPLLKVFEYFSPTATQLREILELDMSQSKSDIEEAACVWAANNAAIFESWYQIQFMEQYWIAAFLCNNDQDKDNYKRIARKAVQFYRTSTKFFVSLYFIEIDCSSESDLTNKMLKATLSNQWPYLIGAIAAGAGAKMAAEYAPQMETALMLYDLPSAGVKLGPAVHATGGTFSQLFQSIRHFILSHKWKRVAILSDETELAKDFVEALKLDESLVIKNIYLNSSTKLVETLRSFQNLNARIFLLNLNSSVSKEILCLAHELKMTPSREYVWILREWRPSNLKCANSFNLEQASHFTISYWWQGPNDARLFLSRETYIKRNSFLNTLKTLNESQYLLPLTVPMVDAIQILIRKFDLFSRKFSSRLYDIHGRGSMRLGLQAFEEQYFDGVLQKLHYVNGSLFNPFILITHWVGNRPTSISKWNVINGEIKKENPEEVFFKDYTPSDGTQECFTTLNDDTFNPDCLDYLWFMIGAFLVIIVFLFCLSWKKRIRNLVHHDSILRAQLLAKEEVISKALVDHLIDRSALQLNHDLGRGNFGRVRQGVLQAPGLMPMTVAVKGLLEDDSSAEESELLREAVTLASLRHPHIVQLIGVCTRDGPLLILMEYAFFGNLRDYLFERRHLVENCNVCEDISDEAFHVSAPSLTRLAKEAVSALEYLSSERLVHRDIRATNCLVDEQRSLKLADFGLARITGVEDLGGNEQYLSQRRGLFPVRWMAPESLQLGLFTAASDIWSLGVLLLELITLGIRPYGNWPSSRVMNYVCAGGHPPFPCNVLPEVRELLQHCWQQVPESRPTASAIARILEDNPVMLRPELGPIDPVLNEECPVPYENVERESQY